jgi:hypothetical protein
MALLGLRLAGTVVVYDWGDAARARACRIVA